MSPGDVRGGRTPLPQNEVQRQQALLRFGVLDTPPEPAFDELTHLATQALDVPVALVSLSDGARQWFKARHGTALTECPRHETACAFVVAGDETLVIPDAAADPRFAGLPLVTGPMGLRFYAGAPLRSADGFVLGTFCVLDKGPRELSAPQVAMLEALARQASHLLELRRQAGLAEHDAQLRAIFEEAQEAIVIAGEDGVIHRVNPAAERIFGHARGALEATSVRRLLGAPQDPPGPGGLPPTREALGLRADGATFPMELSVSAVQVGERRLFTAIIRDVSERKQVERLQAEFVATVSHELRTPLTAIRGALSLLTSGPERLQGDAGHLAEIALGNADRLSRLVNDILDLEKVEKGRVVIKRTPLELSDVVRQSLVANQEYARQFEATLALVEDVPGLVVAGDADRIAQVLTNLVSNACKYTPKGERVEVALLKVNGLVRVTVRDKGPGVPQEFVPRLFQRFAQADTHEARGLGGTGLGLSIARAIVEELDGHIGYEPAPEGGSRFYFELPVLAEVEAGG